MPCIHNIVYVQLTLGLKSHQAGDTRRGLAAQLRVESLGFRKCTLNYSHLARRTGRSLRGGGARREKRDVI